MLISDYLQSDVNLYGSHPFCLVQEEDGQAHGIFFLNSNAMGEAMERFKV